MYVDMPLEYVSSMHSEKGIKISASIAPVVLKSVVEASVQVSGHEGVWHEGVFLILAEGTRMGDVTTARKTGLMVDEFVDTDHTFAALGENTQLKGELQDVMGWGDMIVVDHAGLVIGMARECIPGVESPLTLGYSFDPKYEPYLKFAHRHECVIVVRSHSEGNGICVFSHEALNQEVPECYHIVTEADELKSFRKWKEGGSIEAARTSMSPEAALKKQLAERSEEVATAEAEIAKLKAEVARLVGAE